MHCPHGWRGGTVQRRRIAVLDEHTERGLDDPAEPGREVVVAQHPESGERLRAGEGLEAGRVEPVCRQVDAAEVREVGRATEALERVGTHPGSRQVRLVNFVRVGAVASASSASSISE